MKLDSYNITDAMGGFYIGRFSQADMIKSAISNLERMYGSGRPLLLVQPPHCKLYDLLACRAWITGPSRSSEDDGTHLFIIWFEEKDPIDPLQTALKLIEENGGWDILSKPFLI